jgi:hypothetical protein
MNIMILGNTWTIPNIDITVFHMLTLKKSTETNGRASTLLQHPDILLHSMKRRETKEWSANFKQKIIIPLRKK